MKWTAFMCLVATVVFPVKASLEPTPARPRSIPIHYYKVTETYRIRFLWSNLYEVEEKVHEDPDVYRMVGWIGTLNTTVLKYQPCKGCSCCENGCSEDCECECGWGYYYSVIRPDTEWTCVYQRLQVDGGGKGQCVGLDKAAMCLSRFPHPG